MFFSFCCQVQKEFIQTTENLHGEVAQRQQLSEEIEQVAAITYAHFVFLSRHRVIKWIT